MAEREEEPAVGDKAAPPRGSDREKPAAQQASSGLPLVHVGLWTLVGYFLKLGAAGFGGPIALAGYMQRDLTSRRWISEEEYIEGLAFSQMMPGPLAAQLAMWIGFIRHGVIGASLVGIVFILPAFLIVLVISVLYVAFEGLSVVQALFYGIGPVVIAIVVLSAIRLAKTTVGSDWRMWIVFALIALITVVARTEMALLFVLAGFIGMLIYRPSRTSAATNHSPLVLAAPTAVTGGAVAAGAFPSIPILAALGAFFVKAGAFTFGSGLAIVPFLHQGVVLQHHWLNERQFLDAVAVGVITPGPVVITAAFVGYLVAGLAGSMVAAAAVFLPVYLFVLFVGRYIVRYRNNPSLKGFIKGATAAASGAIAGASVVLAQKSIIDYTTASIGIISVIVLWRFKIAEPILIAVSAVVGLLLYR